jgi:hypothetical protein
MGHFVYPNAKLHPMTLTYIFNPVSCLVRQEYYNSGAALLIALLYLAPEYDKSLATKAIEAGNKHE